MMASLLFSIRDTTASNSSCTSDFLFCAVVTAHNAGLGDEQMKNSQLILQTKGESSLLLSVFASKTYLLCDRA